MTPPPSIERAKADKPTVVITTVGGAIPEFKTPKIDKTTFKIAVSDRDAQPLVRIPPIMPTRAEKSGHCRIRFDVIPEERPLMWPRSFTLKACLRDDYQIGADIEI